MKTVIIGSGNLATQLSVNMLKAGMDIAQVYSKSIANAETLARRLGCGATDDIDKVIAEGDMYVIAVKDDAIGGIVEALAARIDKERAIVVHTAGSIEIGVLPEIIRHRGVMYPMQTFSKARDVLFDEIPVFVEASDSVTLGKIKEVAERLSDHVVEANSEVRKKLHLAAVFACNMTNHCYRLAERVLEEEGLDFSLYIPLIRETARKVETLSPREAQTGPMVRNDVRVMEKQMSLINDELTRDIYRLMAKSVLSERVIDIDSV